MFAVELFNQTGSVVEIQRGFSRELNQQEVTSRNEICRWIRQWREAVMCKRPPGRPPSVRIPENNARVVGVCRPQSAAISTSARSSFRHI